MKIMQQQSIYNIIPKNPEEQSPKPMYRSRFPHTIPPTGSTFCHLTTSKPGVSNLSGEFEVPLQPHTQCGTHKTFGHVKGARKSSPSDFRKKGTGTMGNSQLPQVRNFSYDCVHKKDRVPRSNERPVYGQHSNKNFIISNAIDNILSSSKKKLPGQKDWTKKKDYGKTPDYLNFIKQTLTNEYNLMKSLQTQQEERKKVLSAGEVEQLRAGLKNKWNEINAEYQKMTHIRNFDTTGLKRKKEGYQTELKQIQQDIRKLNREYIFIES